MAERRHNIASPIPTGALCLLSVDTRRTSVENSSTRHGFFSCSTSEPSSHTGRVFSQPAAPLREASKALIAQAAMLQLHDFTWPDNGTSPTSSLPFTASLARVCNARLPLTSLRSDFARDRSASDAGALLMRRRRVQPLAGDATRHFAVLQHARGQGGLPSVSRQLAVAPRDLAFPRGDAEWTFEAERRPRRRCCHLKARGATVVQL